MLHSPQSRKRDAADGPQTPHLRPLGKKEEAILESGFRFTLYETTNTDFTDISEAHGIWK